MSTALDFDPGKRPQFAWPCEAAVWKAVRQTTKPGASGHVDAEVIVILHPSKQSGRFTTYVE